MNKKIIEIWEHVSHANEDIEEWLDSSEKVWLDSAKDNLKEAIKLLITYED